MTETIKVSSVSKTTHVAGCIAETQAPAITEEGVFLPKIEQSPLLSDELLTDRTIPLDKKT